MVNSKVCSKCKVDLPWTAFTIANTGRPTSSCKPCRADYELTRRKAESPEKQQERRDRKKAKRAARTDEEKSADAAAARAAYVALSSDKKDLRLAKGKEKYKSLSPEAKNKKFDQQAKWRKKNPEKRKATINRYHESHKEQENQYYLDNRDYILERESIRRQRPHVRENQRKNIKERRKAPAVKVHNNVSTLIRHHLKKNGGSKNGKSILNCLGYSIEELNAHLESLFEPWMNWENHGVYDSKSWNENDSSTWTWQIDHIKPVSEFVFTSMEDDQFKECWKLSNLRPLSAKENVLLGSALGRKKTKAFVDT